MPIQFTTQQLESKALIRLRRRKYLLWWERQMLNTLENMEYGLVYPPLDNPQWARRWRFRLLRFLER